VTEEKSNPKSNCRFGAQTETETNADTFPGCTRRPPLEVGLFQPHAILLCSYSAWTLLGSSPEWRAPSPLLFPALQIPPPGCLGKSSSTPSFSSASLTLWSPLWSILDATRCMVTQHWGLPECVLCCLMFLGLYSL
jgi:hypothetical protein